MRTIAIALLLASGCSEDADIGVNSQPVTCTANGFVQVSGDVKDPNNQTPYDFDALAGLATRTNDGATRLSFNTDELMLRFGFYCGAAERARYGIRGDTQEGLDCPLEVASVVLGQIEYLPATSGTLIIDETSNCLAGRFAADFGSNGQIGGSFSVPWTQQ